MPDFWDRTVVDVLLLSLPPTKIQLIATNCSGPVKHIKSTSHFRRSIYVTNKLNLAEFYWKYHHHHSAHCRMGPLDECARVSTTMFTVSLPLVISSHCLSYNQFARGQATNIQIINENTKRISNWNLNAYIYILSWSGSWLVAKVTTNWLCLYAHRSYSISFSHTQNIVNIAFVCLFGGRSSIFLTLAHYGSQNIRINFQTKIICCD